MTSAQSADAGQPPAAPDRSGDRCPACERPVNTVMPRPLPAGASERPRHHIRNETHLVASLKSSQDRVADAVTAFAGSLRFVYIHALWFGLWIVANTGVWGPALVFDRYPYGLLTMLVSLEAIFLSTFVMVSQNRQAARNDLRSELDFETNVRSEIWSVHIGRRLGIDPLEIEAEVRRALTVGRNRLHDTVVAGLEPEISPRERA